MLDGTVKFALKSRVYVSLTASTSSGPGRHEVCAWPNERGGVSISIGDDIYISVDDPDDWVRIDSAVREILARVVAHA